MEPQGLLQCAEVVGRQCPDACPDAIDCDRPDLLCLSLRVMRQARGGCGEEHLERVDPFDAGDRFAVAFAPSLLTSTPGRRLFDSAPRTGSSSTQWISPRRIS